MKPMDDTDTFPFGKHRGKMMQDVPASYLHWCWTIKEGERQNDPICDYIERNLLALKKEFRDGIW